MARHREFLPGQRDKSPETGQSMTQYLGDWEVKWKEMSGGHDNTDRTALLNVKRDVWIH